MKRSWRGDGGANAVEFALVLPILLVLLFGLMYGGLVLNEQQQISHAAREASRFGATFSSPRFTNTAFDAFDAVASRASTTSAGITHRDDALLCVMYWDGDSTDGTPDPVRRWYELDTAATTTAPADPAANCPPQVVDGSGNPTGEPWVQVSIRMPTEIQAVFVTMTPTLAADAVSVYEEQGS